MQDTQLTPYESYQIERYGNILPGSNEDEVTEETKEREENLCSIKLQIQKAQMKLAIGFIDNIEMCDSYILEGNNPEYFKSVRQEAIENYAQAMTDLMETILKDSKLFV